MDQSNAEFITINKVHSQNTKLKFKNPLKVSIAEKFTDEGRLSAFRRKWRNQSVCIRWHTRRSERKNKSTNCYDVGRIRKDRSEGFY